MDGYGEITWADGRSYKGTFSQNRFNGSGVYTYRDGKVYTGPFRNGKKHGKGEINIPNKGVYKGIWENDQEVGAATFQSHMGDVSVIGTWDVNAKSFVPKKSEINAKW